MEVCVELQSCAVKRVLDAVHVCFLSQRGCSETLDLWTCLFPVCTDDRVSAARRDVMFFIVWFVCFI